jgi:hypothetical protein
LAGDHAAAAAARDASAGFTNSTRKVRIFY